ncbi:MAG: threonine/serine exporter family protein [Candidatus Nanopelagicales bacterium]
MSLWTVLWAAPAALGFAVLFNVHRRALPIVAVVAILARFLSEFGQDLGLSLVTADYLAAFVVGAIAYTVGPRLREASPVFAFAPVIPLIPGVLITDALRALVVWVESGSDRTASTPDDFIRFASSGFTAAAVVLVLCLGTLSPMLLLPRARTAED